MKRINKIVIYSLLITALSFIIFHLITFSQKITDKKDGLFGHSSTKEESTANNFFIAQYTPSKDTLRLLNNDKIFINEAWAETKWMYKDKQRKTEEWGYNFHIYFKAEESAVFSLHLLNKDNQAFANGIGKDRCILSPKQLKEEMEIVLHERNPIDSIAWIQPLITDTIIFKIKNVPQH